MNATEMINRYINEVGEQLPGKTRADIEQELRSLIQDAVDERSAAIGEQPTTEVVAAVLKEFGAPVTIAGRYRPTEALIGATLFPIYRRVLTITLSIIIGLQMVGVIFSFAENQAGVLSERLPQFYGSFWQH